MGDEIQNKKQLAKEFGLEIIEDIVDLQPSKEVLEKVTYSFVKKYTLLPLRISNNKLLVAICDPLALQPLEDLRYMFNKEVQPLYCPQELLLTAINEFYDQKTGAASELIQNLALSGKESDDTEVEVYDLLDNAQSLPAVVKLINLILTEAIQQGASDIHFEPSDLGLRIRYRIDGILQNRHAPSPEFQSQLLTRIKVMSKLDIAERRLPQDGRIKLRMGKRDINIRVSTLPASDGERIVLRILDKGNVVLGLNQIGMPEKILAEFNRLIRMPEGILLVTGPTGSGKTTTLYSSINEIYSDQTNIMTIEDPVEYNLKGIAQIAVKPKINLTFSTGLRHILRQDPDIILIGEIRDTETAEIAIQASLTGHMVLSTLHTNDAPSAITRLVDMGVEPYLLSSTIVGVLAQRLVRSICSNCKVGYKPSQEELDNVRLKKEELKKGLFFKGEGCEKCFHSGFKGRRGIYELMIVNNAIKRQIVKSQDSLELRRVAAENGMKGLIDHGAQLVKEGVTTVAEVLRVTKGFELSVD